MRITIIGASHLGLTIAKLLANESYDVILVDEIDILTIHADGTSPSLMRDPDIRKSDFLVAATASDESNIIASILARQNGIPHTIARIREMKYLSEPASYLHENFDIDLILSPELITAREIFQLLRTPHALNIEDFAGGRVRLLETKLSTTSPLIHIPLHALSLPPSLLIAMVQRDHDILIPHGHRPPFPKWNPVQTFACSERRRRSSSSARAVSGRRSPPCSRRRNSLSRSSTRTGSAVRPWRKSSGKV